MLDVTDFEACYRAVASRDRRFDGRFVTGVLTTGIYCRPSCPARTPRPSNVRFFPSPAAAQDAGLRACRRCRPELAPDTPGNDPRGEVAARALRLIEDGGADAGVEALAAQVHLSPRQLQRVLVETYGAGPAALARMRRVRLARLLVDQTDLPLTRVAMAAGFGSVRQFNDAFRRAFATAPSAVRGSRGAGIPPSTAGEVTLTLPVRTPFDRAGVLRWAALHAIPSRDVVGDGELTRTTDRGQVVLCPLPDGLEVRSTVTGPDDLTAAIALARQVFDIDADVHAMAQALGDDPVLGPLVAARPGVRIPGAADPLEGAVRVVLGQQVSARGATTLMTRLSALTDAPGIPEADVLATAQLESLIGLTRQRAGAVRALARAVEEGLDLTPATTAGAVVDALTSLPGIGPWTAQVIALLVLRHPDAWPTGDLVLRRVVGRRRAGLRTSDDAAAPTVTAAELDAIAEQWRPWRGYAAMLLWHDHLDRVDAA